MFIINSFCGKKGYLVVFVLGAKHFIDEICGLKEAQGTHKDRS